MGLRILGLFVRVQWGCGGRPLVSTREDGGGPTEVDAQAWGLCVGPELIASAAHDGACHVDFAGSLNRDQ